MADLIKSSGGNPSGGSTGVLKSGGSSAQSGSVSSAENNGYEIGPVTVTNSKGESYIMEERSGSVSSSGSNDGSEPEYGSTGYNSAEGAEARILMNENSGIITTWCSDCWYVKYM